MYIHVYIIAYCSNNFSLILCLGTVGSLWLTTMLFSRYKHNVILI